MGIDTVIRKGNVGETYNIGSNNECANIDIVKFICTLMDEINPQGAPHETLISFVKDRPSHDWRYAIDTHKITNEMKWVPSETFESGMDKTLPWYMQKYIG